MEIIIELKRHPMFLIEGLFFKIFKIEKPEKISLLRK